MAKKISLNYWNKLRPFEQNFIKERIDKNDIPHLKLIISCARKQHPDFIKIYGNGFIELPNGDKLMFTGSDTRRFFKVQP